MPLDLKFIEDIDLPCKVLGTYSCELSKSGCISITTCSSLYIYQIQPLRENSSPSLAIKKFSIFPPNFMLTLNVGIDINSFLNELPQQNFYEGILSTQLSPILTGGNPVEPKIIKSIWSPQIINDYDCLLATLSNTGSVQIVTKTIDNTFHEEFSSIFDVSQKYVEMCRETWQCCTEMKPLEQFNELKRRIHETFPTTFTWSDQVDDYCILIVAHACGDLSFWKVNIPKSKEFELPIVTFMNVFNTKFDTSIVDITAMKFVSVGGKALLFAGNSKGQVNCIKLSINNEQVIVNGDLLLWPQADEISVKDIKFLTYQEKGYILIVKGSDLIILMYEDTTESFDSYVFHAGNIAITALEIIEDNKLLVVSFSGATKELIIGYENSKINVKWRHLYVSINWYIHQALNFVSSVNRVLFIFLTGPCKTAETKDDKDFNKLVVFINTSKDPLQILLHNTTNNLKSHWDCLEALRCHILLDKQLPTNVQNLEKDYDNMSLYQLRLLIWFSKLSETIYEQTGNIDDMKIRKNNWCQQGLTCCNPEGAPCDRERNVGILMHI
ncbi:hypothetical protein AMK59_5678 [Oryctes borbonicus]|uniref:Transcription factor IIIC 90kDa subunit N-terminal domain-containing protein n=1 Tax=Oryctes borbonicus TaxID=1629725 RepID=A0A0T6B3S5_9SCAR|nr:hypothetical protein AMK59_5678 [Oryctes borbonicus]